jgi:hypothetical protein
VLHRDRVRVRILRTTARAAPKAACSTSSSAQVAHHRPPAARRRAVDRGARGPALRPGHPDPQERHGQCRGGAGGGGRTHRAAVAALAAGRPRHRGAGRDRRPRHGDRDRGAQVRGAAPFSPRRWRRPRRCPSAAPGRPQAARRPDATCRWSPSTARTRATSTMRSTASPTSGPGKSASGLAPDGGHRRRQPLRQARASRWTTTPTSAPPRCTSRGA